MEEEQDEPEGAERKHRYNKNRQRKMNRSSNQSNRKSEGRQAQNRKSGKHHLIPSSKVCSIFWRKNEAVCGFEVQGTFPRACHVLANQGPKDKWRRMSRIYI